LHSTGVFPSETSTEPSAVWTKPGVRESGRSWEGVRPPGRKNISGMEELYERGPRAAAEPPLPELGIKFHFGTETGTVSKPLKPESLHSDAFKWSFQFGPTRAFCVGFLGSNFFASLFL